MRSARVCLRMWAVKKPYLSLIIPCYNEGSTFLKSVEEVVSALYKTRLSYEIIFVEDKSVDGTQKEVRTFLKKIKGSRAIFHSTNQGRGKSVTDGLLASKGKICGFLDIDLEVPASYIPVFVKDIENGFDVVVGKRFYDGEGLSSIPRYLASKVYSFVVRFLLQIPMDDTEAGYKFFKRQKIIPILKKTVDKHWFWDTEICARAHYGGLKISQVPVIFKRRLDKKSTVKLLPDTIAYIRSLINFKLKVK